MADTMTYEADFGPKFQFHILAVMTRIPVFALRYRSALSHEFFNDEIHKVVSKAFLIHLDEHKVIPTTATLLEECKQLTSAQTMPYVEALLEKLKEDDISDHAAVAKKTVEWGKTQAMCVAVINCAELIESKKRDKVIARIQQAQLVGEDLLSLGLNYNTNTAARAAAYADPDDDAPDMVATGIKHLDMAMNGGLGRGELGVVIAPPGKGKTTTLIQFGFGALLSASNYDVLHYTLEMPAKKIARRYDDRLMGQLVKTKSMDPQEYGRLLVERSKKFIKGRLMVQQYNTRQASASTFRAHLSLLAADGFHPDLIIVDYGDIVRPERRLGDMRHEQAGVYEDLRQLAGELNCAIWTASQGNKASLDKDVVSISEFAESFEKAAIVDAAIGFCQTKDERVESKCRLFMGKLRNTEDGSSIHCDIYRDRCVILSNKLVAASGITLAEDGIPQGGERAPATEMVTRVSKASKIDHIKAEAGIVKKGPVRKGPFPNRSNNGPAKGPTRKMERPSAKVAPA